MRAPRAILLLAAAGALAAAAPAAADGGAVRFSDEAGPWRVTVFTSPTPLRAGAVDVSVLVQDRATREFVLDAVIDLGATSPGPPPRTLRARAERGAASNRALLAARMELPQAGPWAFQATIARGDVSANLSFAINVAPPLPRWVAMWPWLALPLVLAMLIAAHQVLDHRRLLRRAAGGVQFIQP